MVLKPRSPQPHPHPHPRVLLRATPAAPVRKAPWQPGPAPCGKLCAGKRFTAGYVGGGEPRFVAFADSRGVESYQGPSQATSAMSLGGHRVGASRAHGRPSLVESGRTTSWDDSVTRSTLASRMSPGAQAPGAHSDH